MFKASLLSWAVSSCRYAKPARPRSPVTTTRAPVLPHAAHGRARDGYLIRLLRVAPEDRDPELPRALLHPLPEPPEVFDVRRGREGQGRDESEGPRPRRGDVAQVHRGHVPSDLLGRRPGRDVGPRVPDVRRDDEVVLAPVHDPAVVAEADRMP